MFGVLLNLYPEHLDWHGSIEDYLESKLRLRSAANHLIAADERSLKNHLQSDAVEWVNVPAGLHVSDGRLFDGVNNQGPIETTLIGAHNLANLCTAIAAVRRVGVDPGKSLEQLRSFAGLPHRLQVLTDSVGPTWIDDSISTTPHSTLAAIRAVAVRPLTVLIGGYDRGLDWSDFLPAINCWDDIALVGVGAHGRRIIKALKRQRSAASPVLKSAEDLMQAVAMARELTSTDGAVLLSPGAPSFDAFTDYQARGRRFQELALSP